MDEADISPLILTHVICQMGRCYKHHREKGYSLVSTINKEIQMAAQEAITDELRRLPKAITGYAVAMEVDTGNVVAMASMPDYDPNDWDYDKIKYVFRNGTTIVPTER